MLGFVGLADDPGYKDLGLLPGFRQQLEWNHVEHLDGLIQLGVELPQVIEPKDEKEEYRNNDVYVQKNRAKRDEAASLRRHALFPLAQHPEKGWKHIEFVCLPDFIRHLGLGSDQVLRIDLIATLKFAADECLTLI
jgi:hypothetical protein